MADYNLGTARGVIELTYKNNGAPEKAQAGLKGVGDSAEKSGGKLKAAAGLVAVAGVAMAAGIGLVVNAAADFDQKLSGIKAVSGATGEQMDQVRAKALQLGKDTVYSAGEAADAITELAKAGVSLPDILNGAADATVALASAGGVDLPAAATIASNAMNQFGLSAKEMPKIADLIAGAANASAIDVTDFADTLNYVGPVAKTLGVSIQDTATAIAILGNQGIKGSSAGTALRSILAQLTPQTKRAQNAFKDLGLITASGANAFYDATGKVKPLNEVIQILHDKTKNLTAQQKVAFTKAAFGTEDLAAVSILAGQTGASFDKMTASIDKVKAADVAKTKMDNLKGSLQNFSGSLETLEIELGEKLQPVLKGAVDRANDFLSVVLALVDNLPATIAAVQTFVSQALEPFMPSISRIIDAFQRLYAVLNGPVRAAVAFLIPILVDAAKIIGVTLFAALVAGSYALEGIASAAEFVSRNIKAFGIAAAVAGAILSPILIVNAVLFAQLGVAAAISGVKQVVAWATSGAGATKNAAIMLVNSYKVVGQWIAMGVQATISVVKQVAAWVAQGAAAIASAARVVIAGALVVGQWILMGISALAGAAQVALAWLIALGPIGLLIAAVVAVVVLVILNFGRIRDAIIAAWNAVKAATIAVWNAIKAALSAVLSALRTAILFYINAYKTAILAVWNAIRTATTVAWNAISGAVRTAISAVISVVQSIYGRVVGAVTGAASWLISTGKRIMSGLINGIESMFGSLTHFFATLPSTLWSMLADAGTWLINVGEDIVRGLINGIGNMAGAVKDKVVGVFSGALDAGKKFLHIGSPSKVFYQIGTWTVEGFANGLNDNIDMAKKASAAMANAAAFTVTGNTAPSIPAPVVNLPAAKQNTNPPAAKIGNVRVYIGNEEITKHITTVVDEAFAPLDQMIGSGAL